MRSARVRKPATGVSLFPFLAVLICTMGALIVLLIMVVQQARVQASVVTREQAEAAPGGGLSPHELKEQQEDSEWQREILEKQRAELTQRLADERNDIGHLEDHIRRLQDEWKRLVAQAEELNRTGKVKPDDIANLAEQARLKQALDVAKRELDEAKKNQASKPRSFAIIPYKGPNGTRRQPIYIECRGDVIIFQPEGVTLGPADFDGPLGPGNPFDAALRATREYLDAVGGNQGGEPYPLLVVRPDGAVAYALARSAMKSWDEEFGYELIDQEMKLAFPPPDAQLNATLQRALGDARRRQEMLARVAPSRFKNIGSARGRGGGDGEGFNEHYGVGTGQGGASGGSGNASEGNSRTPGTGGLAASVGGRGGGMGTGNGTGNAGGTGTGTGQGPGTGAGQGVGNGTGFGSGSAFAGPSGNGGSGAFYSAKPAFGKPGPFTLAGQNGGTGNSPYGTGNGRPGGSGGSGSGPGGSGPGGSGPSGNGPGGNGPGGVGPSGTGPGGSGPSGTGPGGVGPSGTGPGGASGNSDFPSNGTAGGSNASGAGNSTAAGNGSSGQGTPVAGGAASGGQFGQGSAGGSAGGTSTFGKPGASGGNSGTSGGTSSGSTGGSAGGSSTGSPGGSSGGSPIGSSGGMPSLSLNQDQSQSSASNSSSSSDKKQDRKPPKRQRSSNWGLPNSANNAVGYTRPIRVSCTADKLVVLPEKGDGNSPQVIKLEANSPAPVEDFVGAVWKHMDRWGSAGQKSYWKPVLSVQVAPGGEERFAELQSQLQGSGLEVKRK